jgi:glyoxylase-like metal-dependent hydrolase (beta-lactamase superfamily II)
MNEWSYRFDLGAFKCVSIIDSEDLAGEAAPFFTGATADEIILACKAHGAEPSHLPVILACLVVDTGSHRILVDTGGGPSPEPNIGKLYERLPAEGIAPESIDTVVFTHWHWDHTYGATLADGQLAFPNARHVVGRAEWDWATADANLPLLADVGGERSRANLLAVKDRLVLADPDVEFVPGVRSIPAPGHTIGHMGLLLTSQGQQLMCIGDIVHHPIHVEHPDWHPDFDFAAEQSIQTRRMLLGRAAAEKMLVFGPHLPPFGVGHFIPDPAGHGWSWRPA